MSSPKLEQLNRLRISAGQNPLKRWAASAQSLDTKIAELLDQGFSDALPGADLSVQPQTQDPTVIEALNKANAEAEEKKNNADGDSVIPSLADSALSKATIAPAEPHKPVTKGKAKLARGLDTDTMARQSRVAVQMQRESEKKDAKKLKEDGAPKKMTKKEKKRLKALKKAAKLSPADQKQIDDEARDRKPGKIAGEVDATKEPEKAERQKKHIKEKQEKREKSKTEDKPKKSKTNDTECTVAGIARDVGMDAKVARAKLRRHEDKLQVFHKKGQDRWTFDIAGYDTIKNILKPKK